MCARITDNNEFCCRKELAARALNTKGHTLVLFGFHLIVVVSVSLFAGFNCNCRWHGQFYDLLRILNKGGDHLLQSTFF